MKAEQKVEEIVDNYGLDCPTCDNVGYYVGQDYNTSDYEAVQCEFCEREPKSKFNLRTDLVELLEVEG